MLARLLALVLVSASCASTRTVTAPAAGEPLERFAYTATVDSVAPGAARVEVRVDLPEEWGSASFRPLGVHGLVGNSMFEGVAPFVRESGKATIGWLPLEVDGTRVQALVVSGPGKPVELTLELARTAGAPVEPAALEAELAQRTTVAVDGVPLAEVAVRLQRVN